MLHIKCPHCGLRSQNEFSYGGDAAVKRPELNKKFTLNRFNTGYLIDEKGLGTKTWIG